MAGCKSGSIELTGGACGGNLTAAGVKGVSQWVIVRVSACCGNGDRLANNHSLGRSQRSVTVGGRFGRASTVTSVDELASAAAAVINLAGNGVLAGSYALRIPAYFRAAAFNLSARG